MSRHYTCMPENMRWEHQIARQWGQSTWNKVTGRLKPLPVDGDTVTFMRGWHKVTMVFKDVRYMKEVDDGFHANLEDIKDE